MRITKYCLAGLILCGGFTTVVAQDFGLKRLINRVRGPISSRSSQSRKAPQQQQQPQQKRGSRGKRRVVINENRVHRFDDLFARPAKKANGAGSKAQSVPQSVPTPATTAALAAGPTARDAGYILPNPFTNETGLPDTDAWQLDQVEPTTDVGYDESFEPARLADQRATGPRQPGLLQPVPAATIPAHRSPRNSVVQTAAAAAAFAAEQARWNAASQGQTSWDDHTSSSGYNQHTSSQDHAPPQTHTSSPGHSSPDGANWNSDRANWTSNGSSWTNRIRPRNYDSHSGKRPPRTDSIHNSPFESAQAAPRKRSFRRGLKPLHWTEQRLRQRTSDWLPQDANWDLRGPSELAPPVGDWQDDQSWDSAQRQDAYPSQLMPQPGSQDIYAPRLPEQDTTSTWDLDSLNPTGPPQMPQSNWRTEPQYEPQPVSRYEAPARQYESPAQQFEPVQRQYEPQQPARQQDVQWHQAERTQPPRYLPPSPVSNGIPIRTISSRREIAAPAPAVTRQPQRLQPTPGSFSSKTAAALQMSRRERMDLIASRGELNGFKGFCPVGLRDNRILLDSLSHLSARHDGTTYYFSTPHARLRFLENPQRYAPVADGQDVVLLTQSGEQRAGRLDFCRWYEDQLYLFATSASMTAFNANPEAYTSRLRK